MKASKFNICVASETRRGRVFCYNTLSESAAILRKAPERSDKKKILKKLGFLVEDQVNEDILLDYWFHKKQMATDVLRVEITPTLRCNFNCEYCIAEPIKSDKTMSMGTAKAVVKWIKEKINEDRPKRVFLQFSGGEPLLHKKVVYFLCRSLKRFCKEKDIKFEFGMFSNGSLTNVKTVWQLNKLGLENLQITLDGQSLVHDKRRPFITGTGSFEIIMNNLRSIAPMVKKLSLRINIDLQNCQKVPHLLNLLKKEVDNKNVVIQIARVIDIDRKKTGMKEFDSLIARQMVSLYKQAQKKGFKVAINKDNVFAPYGMCMFASANSYVIDCDGLIYKCVGSIGKDEFVVGDVSKGVNMAKAINHSMKALKFRRSRKCRRCPFLPVCGGGCRNLSLLDSGDFFKPFCHKDYFKKISLRLLEHTYTRSHG